ncbi:MAG TPA: PKD domain-containing protein [Clostridiales bacterium]|nr:PKD domain-containing protein [Clostridiales bacterium]
MRLRFKKWLSLLLVGIMILGNTEAVSAVSYGSASVSGAVPENVIDYSHEPLGDWGYSFALSNNEYRYQTFTATKDGRMEAVEVAVNKKNSVTAAFIDLKAVLFETADGKPAGEPLAESAVKSGDQVNNAIPGSATVTPDMITRFEIDYELEAGKQYAIVLMSSKVTGRGDDPTGEGQCYDWFTKNIGLGNEYFGKTDGIDPEYNWKDESSLGTGWLKVYYKDESGSGNQIPPIDFTFESSSGGWGFGATHNEWRWQSFTSTATAPMKSVDIRVTKFGHDQASGLEKPNNLIVALYATDSNGFPTGQPLVQTVVPESSIESKVPMNVPLSYNLEKGVRYAIAMTMETPLSLHGAYDCYGWTTSTGIPAAAGEKFGKTNNGDDVNNITNNNWVDESYLGTGYLRVNYGAAEEEENEELLIDYSFEYTQSTGWTMAVADCAHRFQTFTLEDKAKVTKVGINVLKLGDNNKDDEYEHSDIIVKIFATDPSTGMPVGEALASGVVPVEEVENKKEILVNVPVELDAGRYAVAITQAVLPPNGLKDYPVYDWATKSGIAPDEKFGKLHSDGSTVDESWLGTGWLKVFGIVDKTSVPRASRIEVTSDKPVLSIGETATLTAVVYDQFDQVMESQEVVFTSQDESIATVYGNAVTGVSAGLAVITARCGDASTTISIPVQDEDGTIIPAPGLIITQNAKLKPGVYNFGGASTGIIIQGNNITVDGTGVTILNANLEDILADVTSGAYAYKLNPVAGKRSYNMVRSINLSDASSITFSYDSRAENLTGAMKVYVSVNGTDWTLLNSQTPGADWSRTTVDLSDYRGKTISLKLAYETPTDVPSDMVLLIDTIELYEDGVRTFSDMAEAKVYYWWDVSYDNDAPVADSMRNKPFDRTTYSIPTSRYKGTGILADGVSGVTIKGFTLSGFKTAMLIRNSNNVIIEENNLSNNFTDPNGGWGDQSGGALVLDKVNNSIIKNNTAVNNANGIHMKYSNHNKIMNNVFSINSNVSLNMWNSSHNDIRSNDFSWGIRIDPYDEVHARDSTSQLMEAGSNYNYFYRNDFTHGGDGIFIRVGNGWSCEGNVFVENDASFANNNAVESWAGRNYFIRNKANYSSYGFWMGGSDESELYYNEAAYNGIKPRNAPERGAGNGGLVFLNGTAEHVKIVGNHIHHNNGSGIAIRYDVSNTDGYVAGHILIQNNRIEYTTRGSGRGDAIYLDSVDWVDISGNLMTGNVNNGVYKNPSGKYPVTNVFERNGEYLATKEAYDAVVPTAVITANKEQFVVGEEIIFSAANSTSPAGKPLSYRWSMGDGFGPAATVKTGKEVKFTFDKPGYYDVAVTVTDGTWSDIAWMNVNVVEKGTEIGTEDDVNNWTHTGAVNETRTKVQEALLPEVAEYADYYTYYTVDGDKSIYVEGKKSKFTLSYPAAKDLGADFSKDYALSLSVKIHDERNWWSGGVPEIRLYTDKDSYFSYTTTKPFLSPVEHANLGCGQWRSDWIPLYIPYSGNDTWKKSVVGSPDLADINYIEIIANTSGDGAYLWIDGLKSVYTGEPAEHFAPNLSTTGSAIYSSSAAGSMPEGPLAEAIKETNLWTSEPGENSYYGVNFGVKRFVDRIELHLSRNTLGTVNAELPADYTVEYLSNGVWKNAKNVVRPVIIKSGRNTIEFDPVNTEAVRVVFENKDGNAVSVYGFKTLNTENFAAETDVDGNPLTKVESSIKMDSELDSVDLVININDPSAWPQEYHDFIVYLTEASEDGTRPVSPVLATGRVTKEEIIQKGFSKVYNIPMRTADGGKAVLKPGKRYVLCTTQEIVNPDKVPGQVAGSHYRWGARSGIVAGEYCGKITNTNPGNLQAYIENLGTFWMRIHTDRDPEGGATIDYSWTPLPTAGYGLGHQGEPGRYQTFTMPLDLVVSVIDGDVSEGNGWSTVGQTGDNTLELTFNEEKIIRYINVYLEEGHVPDSLEFIANGQTVQTATNLHAGFNLIALDGAAQSMALNGSEGVITDKLTVIVPPDTVIRELEVMGVIEAEPEITGIEILSEPDKTEYFVGETLDVAGGRIKVNYSDDTSEEVEMTADMVTGFDSDTPGTKTLTVTYEGFTATFTVEVKEMSSVLESIKITREPDKTVYKKGEMLDLTGLEVAAVYSDGREVPVTGYTVSGYNKNKIGQQTITVAYEGKKAVFTVTVYKESAATLVSIKIISEPYKTEYKKGEKLDLTGLEVAAVYSDGSEVPVTGYTESGYNKNKIGQQTITVNYKGKKATFTVNVTNK